ncbi:hypothetical protein DFH11DRAFT_1794499 [Phellopilus nigrolimitatus]|nr:hypothetical protein DFH11DRAFT_1794499 [Phellopilus nigrolimitatus]
MSRAGGVTRSRGQANDAGWSRGASCTHAQMKNMLDDLSRHPRDAASSNSRGRDARREHGAYARSSRRCRDARRLRSDVLCDRANPALGEQRRRRDQQGSLLGRGHAARRKMGAEFLLLLLAIEYDEKRHAQARIARQALRECKMSSAVCWADIDVKGARDGSPAHRLITAGFRVQAGAGGRGRTCTGSCPERLEDGAVQYAFLRRLGGWGRAYRGALLLDCANLQDSADIAAHAGKEHIDAAVSRIQKCIAEVERTVDQIRRVNVAGLGEPRLSARGYRVCETASGSSSECLFADVVGFVQLCHRLASAVSWCIVNLAKKRPSHGSAVVAIAIASRGTQKARASPKWPSAGTQMQTRRRGDGLPTERSLSSKMSSRMGEGEGERPAGDIEEGCAEKRDERALAARFRCCCFCATGCVGVREKYACVGAQYVGERRGDAVCRQYGRHLPVAFSGFISSILRYTCVSSLG